jgi:hypothetical protein
MKVHEINASIHGIGVAGGDMQTIYGQMTTHRDENSGHKAGQMTLESLRTQFATIARSPSSSNLYATVQNATARRRAPWQLGVGIGAQPVLLSDTMQSSRDTKTRGIEVH